VEPRTPERQNARTPERQNARTPERQNCRPVLLVEDDGPSQAYASNVLKRLGLVDVATNGAEAIEALSRTDYALVIMDCLLPVMDGVEATKRIRAGTTNARNSSIPIIAYTAHVLPEHLNACLLSGMNDCITKPSSLATFTAIVEKWLPPL